MTPKSPVIGCFKGKTQKKKLDIEHYKKLFQFLKDNGTNTLFFTGGDITIDSERNLRIIEMAYSVGLKKLFCFFGGNRTIPQDVIDNLNKFGVHKFYQIEINEKFIPENNKMLQSLKYDENSTAYFLTVGLFSTKQFNAVLDKIRKLMPLPSIHVDFLVNKNDITPQAEKEIHRLLPPSFVLYSMLTENNYCMKNRLTVFEDGTIGVCPRMEALGTLENLYSGEANTIFEKFWKLTNDKIQPCADCRYRYTCVGCKYTELVVSGSLDHVSTCHEIL